MADKNRALHGEPLEAILRELAEISSIAFSLSHELQPLSQEDIEAGAEPLSQGQIQEYLNDIQMRIAILALGDLKATRGEWYAANDGVQ